MITKAGSGTRRRTWLDTFDWRLDRAGLALAYENARPGSRLLLTAKTANTAKPGQAATGQMRFRCDSGTIIRAPSGPTMTWTTRTHFVTRKF